MAKGKTDAPQTGRDPDGRGAKRVTRRDEGREPSDDAILEDPTFTDGLLAETGRKKEADINKKYSDRDIDLVLNTYIKEKLGGFYFDDSRFLLKDTSKNIYTIITPAIDHAAATIPYGFFLNKLNQQAPDAVTPDDRRDIFDELLPVIEHLATAEIRIFFPFNILQSHWLVGEIILLKDSNKFTGHMACHDPFGGGIFTPDVHREIIHSIRTRLEIADAGFELTPLENRGSMYGRRQAEGDGASCGVVVADDICKLISGEPLSAETYERGASVLREKQLGLIREAFLEDSPERVSFERDNTRTTPRKDEEVLTEPSLREFLEEMLESMLSIENTELKEKVVHVFTQVEEGDYEIAMASIISAVEEYPVIIRSRAIELSHHDIQIINKLSSQSNRAINYFKANHDNILKVAEEFKALYEANLGCRAGAGAGSGAAAGSGSSKQSISDSRGYIKRPDAAERDEQPITSLTEVLARIRSNDPKLAKLDLSGMKKLDQDDLMQVIDALGPMKEGNNQLCYIQWGDYSQKANSEDFWGLKKKIEERLEYNLLNYQHYPSDYELALLSDHSYKTVAVNPDGSLQEVKVTLEEEFADRNLHLQDWKIEKIYNHIAECGYYGVLYSNAKKAQMVLAHRGTDFSDLMLFEKTGSAREDLLTILGNNIGQFQVSAYYATTDSVTIVKSKGYNFAITGHSLGGFLAELSLYYCHFEQIVDFPAAKAVVFDSPGSEQMLKLLKPNVKNWENDVELRNMNLVSYLSLPNIVNSCNIHVGKVYTLFPKITGAGASFVSKATKKVVGENPVQALLSVTSHSLIGIIEQFNPITGKPSIYQKVSGWSHIDRTALSSDIAVDVTESLVKKVLDFTPVPGLVSRVLAKGASKLLHHAIGDTTIATILDLLGNIVGGKIDVSKFFDLQQYLTSEYKIREDLDLTKMYELVYQHKLRLSTIDDSQDIRMPGKDVADWYLKKLDKWSKGEI